MTGALLLLAAGVWLSVPPSSRHRLALRGPQRPSRLPELAALVLGLAAALVIGGPMGIALGVVLGAAARAALHRISPNDTEGRDALARQAPDAVDCLASCLGAGAPLWSAMRVVAAAFGEPLSGLWNRAADRHALGSDPTQTFAEWLADPLLAPVGRLLVRSAESGGALATSLVGCAQQMRQDRAQELELRAQAVGVKAVAPLGGCFLPAFILLAVVPIVGSLVMRLL